jgi:hypothetical protein
VSSDDREHDPSPELEQLIETVMEKAAEAATETLGKRRPQIRGAIVPYVPTAEDIADAVAAGVGTGIAVAIELCSKCNGNGFAPTGWLCRECGRGKKGDDE